MNNGQKYWFPAKRYGWGWGLPNGRAGWLALAAFGVLAVVGVLVYPPHAARFAFVAYTTCLLVALIVVCWLKGEPPKWHWGRKTGKGNVVLLARARHGRYQQVG